jgi:hypothetical protein
MLHLSFLILKRQPKRESKGYFIWAVIGLMALFSIFYSLLDCLCLHTVEELLNNFSKSYPNLTLIIQSQEKF